VRLANFKFAATQCSRTANHQSPPFYSQPTYQPYLLLPTNLPLPNIPTTYSFVYAIITRLNLTNTIAHSKAITDVWRGIMWMPKKRTNRGEVIASMGIKSGPYLWYNFQSLRATEDLSNAGTSFIGWYPNIIKDGYCIIYVRKLVDTLQLFVQDHSRCFLVLYNPIQHSRN